MKTRTHLSRRQNRIRKIVQRGYRLHLQHLAIANELRTIELVLMVEALKRPFEHQALAGSNAGGVEWTARVEDCECHVIFPGAVLQTDFPLAHSELSTIRRICGNRFGQLFTEAFSYQITDPALFYQQVAHLFTPAQASRLIRLCSRAAEPRTAWNPYPPPADAGRPGARTTPLP